MPLISGYYPVQISESRYGAYSGGEFILTAGLFSPRDHLDAWSNDVDCMKFWNDVGDTPAIIELDRDMTQDEVIIHVGDEPSEMLSDALEFAEDGNGGV